MEGVEEEGCGYGEKEGARKGGWGSGNAGRMGVEEGKDVGDVWGKGG